MLICQLASEGREICQVEQMGIAVEGSEYMCWL